MVSREDFIFKSGDLPKPFGEIVLDETFASNLDNMYALIQRMMDLLDTNGCMKEDTAEFKIRLCLDEAMINAVKHGNKMDESKQVKVWMCMDQTQWAMCVKDEGEGFDPGDIPDYDSEEALMAENGRGLMLMIEFMDEVLYYDRGSCLYLKKTYANGNEG